MGIRYWGQPLPAKFVATARANPRLLHIDDDYDDYLWDLHDDETDGYTHGGGGRHALDLDKAFNDFQSLWHTEPPVHRPALELVRGQVTNTTRGWKPHYGIVEPDRVRAVRDDVRVTGDGDIVAFVETSGRRYPDEPVPYIRDLISCRNAILTFLDARVDRGEGVLYSIG